MRTNPEAIFLSIEDLIIDINSWQFIAWEILSAELGIHFGDEEYQAIKGLNRLDALNKILNNGGKKFIFSDEEKSEFLIRQNNFLKKFFIHASTDNISNGIRQFITDCQKANILLGLTAVNEATYSLLEKVELEDPFDIIVGEQMVQAGKPAPDYFLFAAKQLSLNPNFCIGIEGSRAGIRSAYTAGMLAIGIGNKEWLKHVGAIETCESINELRLDWVLQAYRKCIHSNREPFFK